MPAGNVTGLGAPPPVASPDLVGFPAGAHARNGFNHYAHGIAYPDGGKGYVWVITLNRENGDPGAADGYYVLRSGLMCQSHRRQRRKPSRHRARSSMPPSVK